MQAACSLWFQKQTQVAMNLLLEQLLFVETIYNALESLEKKKKLIWRAGRVGDLEILPFGKIIFFHFVPLCGI
jgi:late competence protein required for DNA uptake (superfamily II DNA/RNA helicase)